LRDEICFDVVAKHTQVAEKNLADIYTYGNFRSQHYCLVRYPFASLYHALYLFQTLQEYNSNIISYTAGKGLAWIIHAVFHAFFPQSKMKRQPGIRDCFKKQNKCLLV